jgi:hypothetical protein
VCNESGKKSDDHDCVLQQCQEACKKAGGNEVMFIKIGATSKPRNYQCCKNTKPEQAQQTKPSCLEMCKLVNEPAPAENSWYENIGNIFG